jgi:hypothetical protein
LQSALDIKKLETEALTKKELMQFEFDLNVQLKQMELEAQKEMSKDKNGVTLSDITGPPSTPKPQKSFESKGNDVLGGIDMSRFSPS